MPEAVASQRTEMVQDLLDDDFQEREDVIVDGPRALVPVALGHVLEFQLQMAMTTEQAASMKKVAALLDRAHGRVHEVNVRSADTLSGQVRLSVVRQAAFAEVADMLAEASTILQEASIALRITTRKIPFWETGGYQRGVAVEAVPVPAEIGTGSGATTGDAREGALSDASVVRPAITPDIARAAALIAADYVTRHPNAADDVPIVVQRIADAMQSIGKVVTTDIDEIPRFVSSLARSMKHVKSATSTVRPARGQRITERVEVTKDPVSN